MSPTAPEDDVRQPVRFIPTDERREPDDGVGLCLSGGGYRAMTFHLGTLLRLNDACWLPRLTRVSSVSGGSITAAALAIAWPDLDFDETGWARRLNELVIGRIRDVASQTIDEGAIGIGLLTPGSIGERVAEAYRDKLLGDRTLQDLPPEPAPLFVINATNLATGVLFRFTRPYAADWRVGTIRNPRISLADAVAASSAFPPVLSPFELDLRDADWETVNGNELTGLEYRGRLVLTDGGVYDNLGIETVWKRCRTVLVSDGGGQIADDSEPPGDWARQSLRVLKVIDNQVRDLRKRQLQTGYRAKRPDGTRLREGAYWGIRSDITHYNVPRPLPAPKDKTLPLAELPTRLKRLNDLTQKRLINWGYAICDVGMRAWVDRDLDAPVELPFPDAGIR